MYEAPAIEKLASVEDLTLGINIYSRDNDSTFGKYDPFGDFPQGSH